MRRERESRSGKRRGGREERRGGCVTRTGNRKKDTHTRTEKEKMMKVFAVVAMMMIAMFAGAHAASVDLDQSNFDEMITNSKLPVFVMFFAPWCGHCKALKPTWEELSDKVAAKAMVAKVDCDNKANQGICSEQGVEGFPTLKAFTPGDSTDGNKYEGGRDIASLEDYVNTQMGPGCDTNTLENCSDDEKELIAELKDLPSDEITAQVTFYKDAVTAEDKKFEELLKGLQAQYEEAKKTADTVKAQHKRKIKVLRALAKAKAADAEL